MTKEQKTNLDVVKEYFQKVDAQDFSLMKLFSTDVQIFFPTFGIGNGTEDLKSFASVYGGTFKSVLHHFDEFHYLIAGDSIVVEGSESGTLKNGRQWNHSRFCSVFQFKNGLIIRMHLYMNPDLTDAQDELLLWGVPKRQIWKPTETITKG